MTANQKETISPLVILGVIGFGVALMLFLITFITTQKAATPHKYANLKIPAISPPPKPIIPPLKMPVKIIEATPSGQKPILKIEEETTGNSTTSAQTDSPQDLINQIFSE